MYRSLSPLLNPPPLPPPPLPLAYVPWAKVDHLHRVDHVTMHVWMEGVDGASDDRGVGECKKRPEISFTRLPFHSVISRRLPVSSCTYACLGVFGWKGSSLLIPSVRVVCARARACVCACVRVCLFDARSTNSH
jgi:hypothetical protein